MKPGERKLKLVPPSSEPSPDERPADAAELAEAEALRDALESGRDPFAGALRLAAAPKALAPDDLETVLARALGEADGVTHAERVLAEQLRDDLASPPQRYATEAFELAAALRAAHRPRPLDAAVQEKAVSRALERQRPAKKPGRVLSTTAVALSGLVAVAASLVLVLRSNNEAKAPAAAAAAVAPVEVVAALIPQRTTADLFDPVTPFPRSGGESARIDRIASARASDLRANRFARWGVR